ncbi:hypothetical protein SGFS_098090 [Streptomyces graminofaciens]|uniref:Uncharacterized protein n=1 Tax=Streptomyces graminofaciens TaxID=68212 RepID=A0ABM7FKV0_9ACTN|nr:hypothetical protein SGFS_098090 [Streptomyces graminofaciens]
MVRHRDAQGRQRSYDFGTFPVPEAFQRSLAALFAAKCAPGGGWDSVESSEASWYVTRPFAEFVSEQDEVPLDVDRLTAGHWQAWRLSLPPPSTGYTKYSTVSALLQLDARPARPVREAMARGSPGLRSANWPTPRRSSVRSGWRRGRRSVRRCCGSGRTPPTWPPGRLAPERVHNQRANETCIRSPGRFRRPFLILLRGKVVCENSQVFPGRGAEFTASAGRWERSCW